MTNAGIFMLGLQDITSSDGQSKIWFSVFLLNKNGLNFILLMPENYIPQRRWCAMKQYQKKCQAQKRKHKFIEYIQ